MNRNASPGGGLTVQKLSNGKRGGRPPAYKAFISYSRSDTRFAAQLQSRLERYAVPRGLIPTAAGIPAERRLIRPVFRDEGELVAGASLPKSIAAALKRSKFLILICSPAAARSAWVDQEVRSFIARGDRQRILPIIVSGAVYTTREGIDYTDCFPPSLARSMEGDGHLIWLDARGSRRLSRQNFLRVVAAVLQLRSLDDLIQRDRGRRRRNFLLSMASLALVATIFGTIFGLSARGATLRQAANLESIARSQSERGEYEQAGRILLESIRLRRSWGDRRLSPLAEALLRRTIAMSRLRFSHDSSSAPDGSWSWSATGRELLFPSGPDQIKYDVQDGRLSKAPLRQVALTDGLEERDRYRSPDGTFEASYGGSQLQVVRLATGEVQFSKQFEFSGARVVGQPSSDAPAPVFSSDGKLLTICAVLRCQSWAMPSGQVAFQFVRKSDDQTIPQVSPDGRLLAMPEGSNIRVVDFGSGAILLDVPVGDIASYGFSPDGGNLVTADQLGHIALWRIPSPRIISLPSDIRVEDWRTIALSFDGLRAFWTVNQGGKPYLFVADLTGVGKLARLPLPPQWADSFPEGLGAHDRLLLTRNGQAAIAIIADRQISISELPDVDFSSANGSGRFIIVRHPGGMNSAYTLSGRAILRTAKTIWEISPDGSAFLAADSAPWPASGYDIDVNQMYVLDSRGAIQQTIKLVEPAIRAVFDWRKKVLVALAFDSDGEFLNNVAIYSNGSVKQFKKSSNSYVSELVLSPSGNMLAALSPGTTHYPAAPAELRSLPDGKPLGILQPRRGEIAPDELAFFPNESFGAAHARNVGSISIWDFKSQTEIATLITAPDPVQFRLGTNWVATVGRRSAIFYPIAQGTLSNRADLIRQVCKSALSPPERLVTAADVAVAPVLEGRHGKDACAAFS